MKVNATVSENIIKNLFINNFASQFSIILGKYLISYWQDFVNTFMFSWIVYHYLTNIAS